MARNIAISQSLHSYFSKINVGGKPIEGSGAFYPATVLTVNKDNPILKEEIFGPVAPIVITTSDEQAIELACLAGSCDKMLGLGNRNALDVLTCLHQTHGRTPSKALQANTANLTQLIAPHLSAAIIFKQI